MCTSRYVCNVGGALDGVRQGWRARGWFGTGEGFKTMKAGGWGVALRSMQGGELAAEESLPGASLRVIPVGRDQAARRTYSEELGKVVIRRSGRVSLGVGSGRTLRWRKICKKETC